MVNNRMSSYKNILLILLSCLSFSGLHAQEGTRINILNANDFIYNKSQGDVRKMVGDVRMEHKGTLLDCDSAYLYQDKNEVEAFGNILIRQGDTLKIYGDYLYYSGNTRITQLRNNVRLINNETLLNTNYLDYDLNKDMGYYYEHGEITSGDNFLSSTNGIYYLKTEIFHFQDNVEVINPQYHIYCDTMNYHTVSGITSFFGPTEIISDSNYIYCEKGWYDTKNDVSRFSKNAFLRTNNELIKGDSLYYDRKLGLGEAYGNVQLEDSSQKAVLKGNFGYLIEKTEESMLTGRALFIQEIEEGDSLFLHADTLRSGYSNSRPGEDDKRILEAYYGVRIFQKSFQGLCDSLAYSFSDSTIRFYTSPLLWAEGNQLSADYMELHTKNNKPYKLEMIKSAFIISREDSLRFNQIKGKNMTSWFRDETLYKINVSGNAQAVYFLKDEETGAIAGVNQSESSYIDLYIEDNEIKKINLINQTDGILKPDLEITPEELRLEGFMWKEDLRPRNNTDILNSKKNTRSGAGNSF